MDKKEKIKQMLETLKAVYTAFLPNGSLGYDRFHDVLPKSIEESNEAYGYFQKTVDGLEGLMKDLAYAAYVEDNFR